MKLTIIILIVAAGMCRAHPRWQRLFRQPLDEFDDEPTPGPNETEEEPPTDKTEEPPTDKTEEPPTHKAEEPPTHKAEEPPTHKAEEEEEEKTTKQPAKENKASPPEKVPEIFFTDNWQEYPDGSLAPGKEVRIVYDGERLPGRDKRYGQRAWDIFAEVKYADNGAVQSKKLEGPDENTGIMTTVLYIPRNATKFIIWFKHWGYYSGYSYDSNYGKNYEFPFNQIVFTGDWQEYVKGKLFPGEKFQVLYNATRLPWRDTGYGGAVRAWNIFAHAQFSDHGPVVKQMLDGPAPNSIMATVYEIPKDAKKVIMWFYFTGYRSGTHYDSNYGKNYHFKLS